LKQKYGIATDDGTPMKETFNDRSPSPNKPFTETLSSRYEKLTGRSPSADVLTSSLEELLKSLKNKFGAPAQKDLMSSQKTN
jgi:hypothetical protein